MTRSTLVRSSDSSRKRERQDDEGSDSEEEYNGNNGDEDGDNSGQDSASDISQRGVQWSSDDTSSLSRTEDERDIDNDEVENDDNEETNNGEESGENTMKEPEKGSEDIVMEDRAKAADKMEEVAATALAVKAENKSAAEPGEAAAADTVQAESQATYIDQAESAAFCATESGNDNATGEDTGNPDQPPPKKPKPDNGHPLLTDMQRRLRNAREKNRSSKITDQFDQIRDTMVAAGVIVPKGTKGTILAAAREYIALLQERQRRVLLDNCMLVKQVRQIEDGALGPSASAAVKQVASKNGVATMIWPHHNGQPAEADCKPQVPPSQQLPVEAPAADYSAAFRNCPVALAITTLGGSFMDCNEQFCHITQSSKENILKQTIFSLIAKQDLHNAFDEISWWINDHDRASTNGAYAATQKPIVLLSNLVFPYKNVDYHDYTNATTTNQQNLIRVCLTPIRDLHCQSTSDMRITSSHPTLRYLCVTLLQDHPTYVAGPLLQRPPTAATVAFELPHSTKCNNHSQKIHGTFQQAEKNGRGEASSQLFAIG